MGRGPFLGYYMFGVVVALAVCVTLKPKRIAGIPPLAWWLCLIVGVAAGGYGLSHSTVPSFAITITAIGRTYDRAEHRRGRDTSYFSFRFVPDVGQPVNIQTTIIIPGWGTPSVFNGRTFRVVYLAEKNRALENEAIEIEILSGGYAGYRDSLDARPLGKWLAIPFGAAFGTLFWIVWPQIQEG